MEKYKENLQVENSKILSYNKHVADIDYTNGIVTKLGYWSSTTTKHINYVASELGYTMKEKNNGDD